ncbi:unnamed protein product, partial [Prorocentrum cordatum]
AKDERCGGDYSLARHHRRRFRFGKPPPVVDPALEKGEDSVLENVEGRFRFRGAATTAMDKVLPPEEPLGLQVLEQVDGQFRFKAAAAPTEAMGTSVLEKANGQFRFKAAAAPEEAPTPPAVHAAAPQAGSQRSDILRNGLILLGAGAVGLQLQLSKDAEERERARRAAEERAAREGLLPLLPLALVAGLALPGALATTSQVERRIRQSKEDAKMEKVLGSMFSRRYLGKRTYDS